MSTTFIKRLSLAGLITIILFSVLMTMGCRSLVYGPVMYKKNKPYVQAQKALQANRAGDCELSIEITKEELAKLENPNFLSLPEPYQLKHIPLNLNLADCYLKMQRTHDAIWELENVLRFIEEQEFSVSDINNDKEYYAMVYLIQEMRSETEYLLYRAYNQLKDEMYDNPKSEGGSNLEYSETNEYIASNLFYALKDLNQENYQQAQLKLYSLVYNAPEFPSLKTLYIYAKLRSFSNKQKDFKLEEHKEIAGHLYELKNIFNQDRLFLLSCAHILENDAKYVKKLSTPEGNKDVLDLYKRAENARKFEIGSELENVIKQSSRRNVLPRTLRKLNEITDKDIKRSVKRIMAHLTEKDINKPEIIMDPQPWGEINRYPKAVISGQISDDMPVERILVDDKEIDFVRSWKSDKEYVVDFATSVDLINGRNEIVIEAFDATQKKSMEKLFLTFSNESYREDQIKGRWGIFFSVFDYKDYEIPSRSRFDPEIESKKFIEKLSEGIPSDQLEILENEEATKHGILSVLDELVESSNEAKAEEILLYLELWCHSEFVRTEITPYLIPYDAKRNAIPQTSINLIDILKILQRCRTARRILVITNNERVEEHFKNLSVLKDDRFVIIGASGGRRILRSSSFLSHAVGELERLTLYNTLSGSLFYTSQPPSFNDLFTSIRKKIRDETNGKQIPVLLGSALKAEKFLLPRADTHNMMFHKISELFITGEISRSAYLRALPIITNQSETYTDKWAADNLVKYLRKSISKEKLQQMLVTERSGL